MAEIQFRPICSNCKQIIYDKIDFGYDEDAVCDKVKYPHNYWMTPIECPNCGELFEMIIMPRNLPFQWKK